MLDIHSILYGFKYTVMCISIVMLLISIPTTLYNLIMVLFNKHSLKDIKIPSLITLGLIVLFLTSIG